VLLPRQQVKLGGGAEDKEHGARFGFRPGRCFALRGSSAPLRRPIGEGGTREHECHTDFRIDVRQEVGNPPRRVGLPINERWTAGRVIAIKPQGATAHRDDPSNNC
jgi:hypothetical protein